MKACPNSAKANLAPRIKNPVSDFSSYIAFLNLAVLDKLAISNSLLLLLSSFLIVSLSPVKINLLAERLPTVILSIEVSGAAI